jgi:hypothetical protein|tara:strand:- start:1351 stop:1620 length:270 start_codon:yes stop_codon:yes gene_type:complete
MKRWDTVFGSGIPDRKVLEQMKTDNYLDVIVSINNEDWRVAEKVYRYGREWQYTLSHENVDGTYKSMQLNEKALKNIIESGSKVIGDEL